MDDTNVSDPPSQEYSSETGSIIEQLKEEMGKHEFGSMEEVNNFLSDFNGQQQKKTIDDFLGLSPEQMHKIIYTPFAENQDILQLQNGITEDDVNSIPYLKDGWCFLNRVNEMGNLKATAKGNLPRSFVRELYEYIDIDFPLPDWKPAKEDDVIYINSLRHILDLAGLIKKMHNTFSCTMKAKQIVERQDYDTLYQTLFVTVADKFNWAYSDYYDELSLIQNTLIFDLYMLREKASSWIPGKELGRYYLQAFPSIVEEVTYYYHPF